MPRAIGGMAILAASLIGCASARLEAAGEGRPSLTMPARIAEGKGDERKRTKEKKTAAKSPASPAAEERKGPAPALPDPEALRTPLQWRYVFSYRRGDLGVEKVELLRFDEPVVTARRIGRFAVELWIGRELIDRVRFDFPLLAASPAPSGPRRPLHEPPTFAAGADVSREVLVPASERATRAVLVDRATGETLELPWPPPVTPTHPPPP